MNITDCLLDIHNNTPLGRATVADCVRAQGKKHLWDERSSPFCDTIVIHYMSAVNVTPARPFSLKRMLKIFCDYGVSSHYLIQRNGVILRLVPEKKKAWHAGGSIMPGRDGREAVNNFSIGIELVATPRSGFTKRQYAACASLCRNIEKRRGKKFIYVGHEDIAGKKAVWLGLRKDIKRDPGSLFNWNRFRTMLRFPAA
ncbi:MAG TPA: N-acetylmuramoyl-L-alanine amidase [Chitinivibrionales bacterium]|nr:N-acetylmuramoyl-L-alanine amidase [Chitinivibrionales bacterium]